MSRILGEWDQKSCQSCNPENPDTGLEDEQDGIKILKILTS